MVDVENGHRASHARAAAATNGAASTGTGAMDREEPTVDPAEMKNVVVVKNLDVYTGFRLEEKLDSFVKRHPVAMISKTWSPFARDAKEVLGRQLGVTVHSIEVNMHPDGPGIFRYLSNKYNHFTVPLVFLKGKFVGGCEETQALYKTGELEQKHLAGLITRKRTVDTQTLETAQLAPVERSIAHNPPFWFPNHVNNHVVRVTGLQVFALSVISAAFHYRIWARYIAVALLVDFALRMLVGATLSPLGMVATALTSFFTPDPRPGPPKQFAAFCGVFMTLMAVLFYFLEFRRHDVIGAVFMGIVACASGLEGFFDLCLGCLIYGFGVELGLIPDSVYRIYTSTRHEIIDSWEHKFSDSAAPVPETVDTNPGSPIALKYKKKSADWTKDDFDVIRHMQISYFAMPLSIGGLAVAYKIGSDWADTFRSIEQARSIIVPDTWSHVVSFIGAFAFINLTLLYLARLIVAHNKCQKEWDCPLRSNGFGMVSSTFMLYSFLVYDEINERDDDGVEEAPQLFARLLWWIGAILHACLTFAKFGEWVGRRLELEHVHPQWMIWPVGLAIGALTAPLVGVFEDSNQFSKGDVEVARFFYSFAWLLWITLFVVTFFKVVTQHNSNNHTRDGIFLWIATPCILGLADFAICTRDGVMPRDFCAGQFSQLYFVGLFIFLGLIYATFPHFYFFGRASFHMGYWYECFAINMLAAGAAMFYALNGWQFSQTMQFLLLTIASVANGVAVIHTCLGVVHQRGVFTPQEKWGPLSFMILTHEAFRSNMQTLRHYIDAANVDNDPAAKENLGLFAAHFNRFCILYEEHSKHEDEVIFKAFNDFFPDHARKWNDDHAKDRITFENWRILANKILDETLTMSERQAALEEFRADIPAFFENFEEHLVGEEDHLQPVARKYLPIAMMKDISRKVWELTSAERWEVIVPFVVTNLPRHPQRVQYIKVLCWSMPERAQQIGAIIYRNVDAVMWERLRVELPEIIPRGAPGWKRYY